MKIVIDEATALAHADRLRAMMASHYQQLHRLRVGGRRAPADLETVARLDGEHSTLAMAERWLRSCGEDVVIARGVRVPRTRDGTLVAVVDQHGSSRGRSYVLHLQGYTDGRPPPDWLNPMYLREQQFAPGAPRHPGALVGLQWQPSNPDGGCWWVVVGAVAVAAGLQPARDARRAG